MNDAFPTRMLRKIDYPNETRMEDYTRYNNIEEAILHLLTGPDVEVYMGNIEYRDWCLPMSKYEMAMHLLVSVHLSFLRQRLLGIEMGEEKFFLLLFLLCAAPGRYKFQPVYNPERFDNMSFLDIYRDLSGIDVPAGKYALTEERQSMILGYFQKGCHMYYFLAYSRRVLNPDLYFERLRILRNRDLAMIDNYFANSPEFSHASLSIANNIPAMLAVEHYQNFNPNLEGVLSLTAATILDRMELKLPQQKTRRQLIKMYLYSQDDIDGTRMLPHFGDLTQGKREIVSNGNIVKSDFYDKRVYFPYYVTSLASKLKSRFDLPGKLGQLATAYNKYRYGIEYLYELTKISSNPDIYTEYLTGLAAYHLLYQCLVGRTSKYYDLQFQNLSAKPGLEALRQIIERCNLKCDLLRTLPFYEDYDVVQRVYPIEDTLEELYISHVATPDIDNTIGIICSTLEVTDSNYAQIINSIIEDLELRRYYGIIKTKFTRPLVNGYEIDHDTIKNTYKRMNLIADFQGRNPFEIDNGMVPNGNRYDIINSQLEIANAYENIEFRGTPTRYEPID